MSMDIDISVVDAIRCGEFHPHGGNGEGSIPGSPAKFRGRCIVHGMAGCVKTEKAALAGPPSLVVSTAAVAVKFD